MFDITSDTSFKNLDRWKAGFLEHAAPSDPNSFPFVLIGNKVDRENERKVTAAQAQEWCQKNGGIQYYETSATQNVQVQNAFLEMAKAAIKRE